jgi:aryl-alcohol dehydrogenase-like predicted oxidoreductase
MANSDLDFQVKPAGSRTPSDESRMERRHFLTVCGALAGATLPGTLPAVSYAKEQDDHLVRFGPTDLFVTRYCQGTAFRQVPRSDNAEARAILHRCLDVGVNFFDSAEAYGWGGSETVLGRVVRPRRDQVIICTKAAPSLKPQRDPDTNKFKLGEALAFSREVVFGKLEGSLKRLGTDYLDLYLYHQPDQFGTPMEELAEWMDALVQAGKIRYWGVSNFAASQVQELFDLGRQSAGSSIAGTEDYYNIAARERFEPEMTSVLRRIKLGLMAFSPQDTGNLAPGREIPPPLQPLVDTLDEVAHELGATRPQVTIAWSLSHSEVTTVLGGAERPEHVEENFGGTTLKLPDELLAKLSAASDAYMKTKDSSG